MISTWYRDIGQPCSHRELGACRLSHGGERTFNRAGGAHGKLGSAA